MQEAWTTGRYEEDMRDSSIFDLLLHKTILLFFLVFHFISQIIKLRYGRQAYFTCVYKCAHAQKIFIWFIAVNTFFLAHI